MPYRTEPFELSRDEEQTLRQWTTQCEASDEVTPLEASAAPWLLLDTDVGTDVDDSLALLYTVHALRERKERLVGVTTCYGPTELRARIARMILDGAAGFEGTRVVAGAGVPCGTHRPIWTTGTEGLELLDTAEIAQLRKRNCNEQGEFVDQDRHLDAARFIVKTISEHPNQEVQLICIGPLTNIALALQLDPSIASKVARLVFMGQGKPRKEGSPIEGVSVNYTNHNISADTAAAVCVFNAPFREIVVINDAVTNRCWFQNVATRALLRWGLECPPQARDECATVGRLLGCWLEYRTMLFHRRIRGTCPHDGLTLAEALRGGFVGYRRGRLLITEWAGYTCFVSDARHGNVFLGHTIDSLSFLQHFTEVTLLNPNMSEIALENARLLQMDSDDDDNAD